MTHARACCCGESDPNLCANGDPLPAGCYLVQINGVQAASCSANSASPLREWRVTTLSVPVGFVIEADGIQSNTVHNRTVPVVAKLTSYDINDGTQKEQLYYCEANIRVTFGCHRPGFVGTPRYWFYTVTGSLANRCGGDGFGQPFIDAFFNGGVVIGDGSPIGTPNQNYNSNADTCSFVGTGGSALVSRIGDCDQPGPLIYARSCDGSQLITVDLATRDTIEASAVEYQGQLYELTNDPSKDPPVSVVWVDRSCEDEPDPTGNLFQLCGSGNLPGFVRVESEDDVDYIEATILGNEYAVSTTRFCRDRFRARYQRVIDEGQVASTPGTWEEAIGCANPIKIGIRVTCRIASGAEPGDPTRPSDISFQGRGTDRPTYPISDDFDPESERRRQRQGGCCGPVQ